MAPTMNFQLDNDAAIRYTPRHAEPRKVSPDHPALHGSLTPPITCPTSKLLNFSPGPTNLPPEVEATVQSRCFPSPHEKRLGSMALSHRSPEFGSILRRTVALSRQVMEVPDEYEILFTQGGGHGQFAAIPMNLCPTGSEAATYIVNGTWSGRAVQEAKKYCSPKVISAMNEDGSCTSFPSLARIKEEVDPNSAFLYVCSNETVNGLELHRLLPELDCGVPLVVDASSDFTSKPIAWRASNIGILFACASKNIGHPGLTMVIIRKDLLGKANPFTPGVFNYETNILADNVWNTIPTFNVDVVGIMMEWILDNGGVHEMERRSIDKSNLMYAAIDDSNGFFGTRVDKASGYRSRMNVPFCVASGNEALTDLFLVECWERGIIGLRTVTPFGKGIYLRASLYHGVALEEVAVLAEFMKEFSERHSISRGVGLPRLAMAASGVASVLAPTSRSSPFAAPDSPGVCVTPLEEPASPHVKFHRDTKGPLFLTGSPLFQEVADHLPALLHDALNLGYDAEKGLGMLSKRLSTSPDTVTDLSVLTCPKNMKVNRYSRVSMDMFAPPEMRSCNSPPATLR